MTVKLCPLGDAMTRGSKRDATGTFPATLHPSYRYNLGALMRERGYDVAYVGSQTYPDFPDATYPAFDQDNEAHGGDTTCGVVAANVASWTAGYTPDIVLLWVGREDAFDQTLVADRINAMSTIITRLREKNPKVWVLVGTIPPTFDGAAGTYRTQQQIVPFNTALGTWAAGATTAASPVIVVDMHSQFSAAYLLDDGLELSTVGDWWIAGRWILALDDVLPRWSAATGIPYRPESVPDPGDPGDPPNPAPTAILPRLWANPVTGTAPVEVTFIDKSVVDVLTRTFEVWLLDNVSVTLIQNAAAFLPSWVAISGYVVHPTEGTAPNQWHREYWYNGVAPWPNKSGVIIFYNAETTTNGWNAQYGGLGSGDSKVALPLWNNEIDGNKYYQIGQRTHHECLHTIAGLESHAGHNDPGGGSGSDALYNSEGFRVWLAVIDPDHPLLDFPIQTTPETNPACPGRTMELLGLFYRYLDEQYRTTPGLHGNIAISYDLDFKDGTPHGTEPDLEHTYTTPGTYSPTYKVSSSDGASVSMTATNLLAIVAPASYPTATFSANRRNGTAPLDVQFTYTGVNATSWLWDFGDGHTSTLQNPAHVYEEAGPFDVRLTATGAGGTATQTETDYIIVADPTPLPPSMHMITPAGIQSLLGFIAAEWAYVQVLDLDGTAVGDRIWQEEAWSQDELGQVWIDMLLPAAPLTAHLPLAVGGVEIWTAAEGGNRITRILWTDEADVETPELRQANDSLAIHVGVGLTGTDATPRITDALVAGSTRLGDMAVISFTLYGGVGQYRIDAPSITRDVLGGGEGQIRLTFTRIA